jgi:16S rRNA (uracil1498-N3)-methyltransferase
MSSHRSKHAWITWLEGPELGRRFRPVMTSRTVAERVNLDRMRANLVEAAEQCNLVHVPEVLEPEKLEKILATGKGRSLVCDETMVDHNPLESRKSPRHPAVLIG